MKTVTLETVYCQVCHLATPKKNPRCIHGHHGHTLTLAEPPKQLSLSYAHQA